MDDHDVTKVKRILDDVETYIKRAERATQDTNVKQHLRRARDELDDAVRLLR
ncbi:MAG: hypothetical protein WEC34_05755 [Acidimicrobiia bacterium]